MKSHLRPNMCSLRSPGTPRSTVKIQKINSSISEELKYSCRFWASHIEQAGWVDSYEETILQFLNGHFLHWVEVLALIGRASDSISTVETLQRLSMDSTSGSKALSEFLQDAQQLLRNYISIIDGYPLQLYSSVLIFAPQQSVVANSFNHEIVEWIPLQPERETAWSDCRQIMEGHQEAVTAAVFSTDSSLIASASDDSTVRIWRVSDGTCIHKLVGHKETVYSVAFFPSGDMVVSGSPDKTVKLWSIEDGKCLHTLKGHNSAIREVAVSPDSSLIAFASYIDDFDGSGKVWIRSVDKRHYLHELQGHWGAVYSVAFSPDSTLLAAGTEDGVIRIWQIEDCKCLYTLKGHEEPVYSVDFAPDTVHIASSSSDGTTRVWHFAEETCVQEYDSGTFMTSISVSTDSTLVATASSTREIEIWNVDTGSCDYRLHGHVDSISSVSFSPDSKLLVSASGDSSVRTWSLSDQSACLRPEKAQSSVDAIEMSPDFSILASAAIDGSIKFWNTADGKFICNLKVEDQNYLHITELNFSHDGRLLLSVAFSGEAWLWDVEERACVHDFTVYDWGFCAATFPRDSKDLIIGCEDGVVRRFEVSTDIIKDLPGHEGMIEVVSISPDTMLVASGDSMGVVRLWELNHNLCVNELTGHSKGITSIAFSPGSLQLATASLDKTVRLWSIDHGTCMRLLTVGDKVNSLTFSPNTLILAAVAANEIMQLWNTGDGDLLKRYKFPRVGTCDIKFDSEGKTIFCEAGAISIEQSSSIDERSCSSLETVTAGFAISRDTQWITWRGDKVLWLPVSGE
ncbi:hypothetical protein KAF25_008791 [Fusarium avenaceum]|uniref:Uncharacterized protein n=1 Tax=Fusarium avenaceum TaxID=40199 RepID=A0A9P7H8P6_9HYPO|nr:hypothetical protein KAF25_008791 [Fusarium avenaceum]